MKLIPEFRFPEFVNDGEWSEIKLKQYATFYRGLTYGKNDTANKGLLVLRSGNIQNDTLVLDKDLVFVEKECPDDLKLLNGDIVICMSNGSKSLVGKNAEYQGEYDGKITVGAFCSIMRPKNRFTKYLLQSDAYQTFIALSIGGGNINNLKNSDLEEFECIVPKNLPEQQKIASCLSSLDELLAAHNDKLGALKDHKKGLMQNLFPQEGETVPKVRFKEFEGDGEWNFTILDGIADISSGGTPSRSKMEYWNGNIPWVSTTLIDFNEIKKSNEFITTLGLKKSSTKIFPKGTILMAMYGQGKTRGKVAVLGFDAAINQACAAIKLNAGMNVNFVFQNLASRYDEIRTISNQGGQDNLSGELVKNIPICYPSTKSGEQQKIASCLSALDELITAQAEKIEQLQQHKKGLMQGLFPKIND
ncbi:type I restriction enzyme, S subunit [Reichenbachiella agariperforans]|uniref:Type I restriction enzyme, S subunit n=2 Tax=Reichenbachiella agariperforans TaxID=156994 RepID=A0A1M6PSS6_REIAG|nr:type I restriction enzyme, S subunit [Reichenbachiella agariperforans]